MEQTKLVPRRRFREFQDTDAWEQRKLSDLAEVRTGKAFSSVDFSDDGEYLVVTNKNILDEANGIPSVGDRIDISEDTILDNYLLSGDNILVTMDGVNIGKTGKYSNEKAVLAQRVGRLNSEQLEFVYQITRSDKFVSEMNKLSVGNAIKHISLKQISDYSFLAPLSEEEQEKIGTFFNQLDNLITLHQRKLDKTQALKTAYLSEMFPAEGESEPKWRFAGFTDAWEQRKYGEVIDLLSGQDFSPSEYNDTCNGIPYMTGASCIVGKETIVNRWTTVPRCLAEKGDVLLVCKGSGYGAIAVLAQEKAHIARQFMALKNLPNLDKVFNFYLLNSVIENIKKDARGLIAGIARDAVIKQEISIPSLEEQSQIGVFFNKIDNLITFHQRKLEKFKKIKKAYLNEMFV
ncbi:restriction endonuclease subunit S [Paenibacillus sonchi]